VSILSNFFAFRGKNKLGCFSPRAGENIWLGGKGLPGTNTLAYLASSSVTKSLATLSMKVNAVKLFLSH
jgi:hypothetical protein